MNGFFKGMGMGLLAGAIVTMAIVPIDRKRLMRSKMGRTFKSIGNVCENLQDAF